MRKNRITLIISLIVVSVILYILYDSLSQPGVKGLKGNFQEVSMYRNENNTGPIIRIYAVTTSDTLWDEMKKYGDIMLHTKYGNTKVYFFKEDQPVPHQLFPGSVNFEPEYNSQCLAKYEKDVMDQVTFIQYPFEKLN
jgi:hypothetical protein